MKFIFSERGSTVMAVVVGLLLFFHPHLGPQPLTKAADCSSREVRERKLVITAASRRQFLLLRLCDTLVIVNGDTKSFYPAPGPHPYHGSYPELDPKRELTPGESFPARLSRPGNYQIHNDATEHILAELTIIGFVQ